MIADKQTWKKLLSEENKKVRIHEKIDYSASWKHLTIDFYIPKVSDYYKL